MLPKVAWLTLHRYSVQLDQLPAWGMLYIVQFLSTRLSSIIRDASSSHPWLIVLRVGLRRCRYDPSA
jgi:hypothetical protein